MQRSGGRLRQLVEEGQTGRGDRALWEGGHNVRRRLKQLSISRISSEAEFTTTFPRVNSQFICLRSPFLAHSLFSGNTFYPGKCEFGLWSRRALPNRWTWGKLKVQERLIRLTIPACGASPIQYLSSFSSVTTVISDGASWNRTNKSTKKKQINKKNFFQTKTQRLYMVMNQLPHFHYNLHQKGSTTHKSRSLSQSVAPESTMTTTSYQFFLPDRLGRWSLWADGSGSGPSSEPPPPAAHAATRDGPVEIRWGEWIGCDQLPGTAFPTIYSYGRTQSGAVGMCSTKRAAHLHSNWAVGIPHGYGPHGSSSSRRNEHAETTLLHCLWLVIRIAIG